MRPERLAVVGLGSQGLSLAWQARRAGVAVVGYDPVPARAVRALQMGALQDRADALPRALRGADLVVLAGRTRLQALDPFRSQLEPKALLLALTPVLTPALAAAAAMGLADRTAAVHPFLPATPPAPDRYREALVYVAAADPEGERAARETMAFWREVLEAHPVRIAAERHDRQVAWTSQVAQVLARALASALSDRRLSGASLAPGTRALIEAAGEEAEGWTEAALGNAAHLAEALSSLRAELGRLEAILAAGDAAALRAFGAAEPAPPSGVREPVRA